ncbi:MAG TPA: helix-turn-helix domain-containing protein [Gammaproteobacteria bacterium]|nr:helix-turn-helix domain-containing protein [Gammaproteobacteria bacterium]
MHPGHTVPHDPERANRQLNRAWEQFIGSGRIRGESPPRPVILESWERSRQRGIDPVAERAPTRITLEEIEEILATQTLGRAGGEVLQTYAQMIHASGHVIVLADAQGRILHSVGDRDTRDHLERINFRPGGLWSEDIVGPNGIGTPLWLGRPEVVFGSEHYCRGWQPWVCYGSPVRDPAGGTVLGAVDITGPARHAHIETMALTVAIAQAVEHKLQQGSWRDREILRTRYRALERRWPADGLLLLDRNGGVLEMNQQAARQMGWEAAAIMNRALDLLNPQLWDIVRSLCHGRQGDDLEVACFLENGSGALRLHVEPAYHDRRLLGYVLVFMEKMFARHKPSTPDESAPPARRPLRLRELEDEIIRQALAAADGSITLAAKRLGVNRSTIYRRIKQRYTADDDNE